LTSTASGLEGKEYGEVSEAQQLRAKRTATQKEKWKPEAQGGTLLKSMRTKSYDVDDCDGEMSFNVGLYTGEKLTSGAACAGG